MTDIFEYAPQVWNAAQLRDALKDLPADGRPAIKVPPLMGIASSAADGSAPRDVPL
ncbi:DUF6225 family protein [Streptomyces sp. NPDC001890]|uniref:DUF6225 family protein n=1 Tax=Streptomyces sp. NPDC001890 TaxID=3364620 RepID=UPI0036858168